jgi:uncharacterized protein
MEKINFDKALEKDTGAITALENGKEVGKLIFSHTESELIVDHTEVNPEKRGGNIGPQLVKEALQLSQHRNLDIDSNCGYAKKVLQRLKSKGPSD